MSKLNVKIISPDSNRQELVSELLVLNSKEYTLKPFDEQTIAFFDIFSKKILSDKSINTFPEIVALGFWLRKSNIQQLVSENIALVESKIFILSPIGKVLHICPANVDTMFVYSLAVSLLVGNKNILRISNRMQAEHVAKLFNIINSIVSEQTFYVFRDYINIISYEHSDDISNYLSSNVNVRIIWGGDRTIETFKKFKVQPRTKDIVFADRVSMLFINSDNYLLLGNEDLEKFMKSFYNDAYTFDQMGCSSPQTLYFVGDSEVSERCIVKFRNDLSHFLPSKYEGDIQSLASLKLNRMIDDVMDNRIKNQYGNNYIKLLELENNSDESVLHGCGGGYFYFKKVFNINDVKVFKNPKVQTIAYWGLSNAELNQLKNSSVGEGIDRIVPMGEALNFHYIWDGYNLFDELSKKVFIK
jgi:hypothetical protein